MLQWMRAQDPPCPWDDRVCGWYRTTSAALPCHIIPLSLSPSVRQPHRLVI
jgi:hypothetical protein